MCFPCHSSRALLLLRNSFFFFLILWLQSHSSLHSQLSKLKPEPEEKTGLLATFELERRFYFLLIFPSPGSNPSSPCFDYILCSRLGEWEKGSPSLSPEMGFPALTFVWFPFPTQVNMGFLVVSSCQSLKW